ncbi:PAS domain-containing protein [Streptomyces sp. S9]|nr:PAS domain-containing protein [Streptomyces sp. S9]
MDRGTERDAPPRGTAGDATGDGTGGAGRVPLAAVVVDREGLVSHWSTGARRLFGVPEAEAIGRPALDLLPVSGALPDPDDDPPYGAYDAYDGLGPGLEPSLDRGLGHPAAGRARLTVPERDRVDVLWWAYPLVGPGPERLLVLAADAGALHRADAVGGAAVEHIAPGFALHTDVPDAEDFARRLPEMLPGMSAGAGARIAAQILELGYPVMEFSQNERVAVTPDWGLARPVERAGRRERTARTVTEGRPPPDDSADPDGSDDPEGSDRSDGDPVDLGHPALRARLAFVAGPGPWPAGC